MTEKLTQFDNKHEAYLPEVNGIKMEEDENGFICLNPLYLIAGKPKNLRSSQWIRHPKVKALKNVLEERIVCDTHTSSNKATNTTYYVKGRGQKAKTFAHPVLALEYAETLNPALGLQIKDIFLKFKANDIGLANEIFDKIAEQVEEDEIRIHNRKEITIRNKELATQGARAGCTHNDYAELHNSGYRGLYNGLDASDIHRLKKLDKKQKILDHMSAPEGAANVFRVTQAKLAMQARKPKTPEEAFEIAKEAGEKTRQAMADIGGIMPEDMPIADGINNAKKRLKQNKALVIKTTLQ